jgi:hypothetical protein
MAYTGTRRAVQSRLWHPRDLGSVLCLWLDAGDLKTFVMNGAAVASWFDKSGNVNTVTASGTAQPSLVTTSGVSYVSFNGTTNILASGTTGNNFPFSSSPRSVFAVVNPTSGIANGTVVSYGQAAVGHNGAAYALLCDSSVSIWLTAFNIDVKTAVAPSFSPQVFSCVSTGATTTLFINAAQVATGAEALVTSAFHSITVGGAFFNAANSLWWKGGIAQIIFLNAAVNNAVSAKCEGYLAWKCGLQGSLPSTHQYKLAPPRVAA